MSHLAHRLIGGAAELLTVSGTLSGSGSLSVAAGAVLVTLTGRGGTGSDNSWYDPGQPYIAPSGYVAAVPASYAWSSAATASGGTNATSQGYGYNLSPPGTPTAAGQTAGWLWESYSEGLWYWGSISWTSYEVSPGSAAYYTNPGQPYIAPSSGGGVYAGGNTTATLDGVTRTWAGGTGGVATESTQTLSSTGAGQTLTYALASGGTLSYSYQY